MAHTNLAKSSAEVLTAAEVNKCLSEDASGNMGIPAGAAATPGLYGTGDENTGLWFPAADTVAFSTAGSERLRIDSTGKISTGAESAPDVSAGGICLNQGAEDGNIISLKSSDIAHGITGEEETDTYFSLKKNHPTSGGVGLTAISEAGGAIGIDGWATTEDTTDTSSSYGAVSFRSALKSGTTVTTLGATGNLFAIRNLNTTRFLIKGNGDGHITNTTLVTLDTENDIQLARDLQLATTQEGKYKVSKEAFQKLIDVKALSSSGDFQILQGMNAVSLGAISQLFNVIKGLAKKMGVSEVELLGMAKEY